MGFLIKLLNILNGYKTYLTAAAAILTATVSYLDHHITLAQLIEAVFLAIQTANIRHAITTTVSKATGEKL